MENDPYKKGVDFYTTRFAKEQIVGMLSLQYNNPNKTAEEKQQIFDRLKELLIDLYGAAALKDI